MGPAPMIRMVEMSVRLGIRSRKVLNWHKKRARFSRVPWAYSVRRSLARWRSLDQIPEPRNPQNGAINGDFRRDLEGGGGEAVACLAEARGHKPAFAYGFGV